jgi:hypothetical protein
MKPLMTRLSGESRVIFAAIGFAVLRVVPRPVLSHTVSGKGEVIHDLEADKQPDCVILAEVMEVLMHNTTSKLPSSN